MGNTNVSRLSHAAAFKDKLFRTANENGVHSNSGVTGVVSPFGEGFISDAEADVSVNESSYSAEDEEDDLADSSSTSGVTGSTTGSGSGIGVEDDVSDPTSSVIIDPQKDSQKNQQKQQKKTTLNLQKFSWALRKTEENTQSTSAPNANAANTTVAASESTSAAAASAAAAATVTITESASSSTADTSKSAAVNSTAVVGVKSVEELKSNEAQSAQAAAPQAQAVSPAVASAISVAAAASGLVSAALSEKSQSFPIHESKSDLEYYSQYAAAKGSAPRIKRISVAASGSYPYTLSNGNASIRIILNFENSADALICEQIYSARSLKSASENSIVELFLSFLSGCLNFFPNPLNFFMSNTNKNGQPNPTQVQQWTQQRRILLAVWKEFNCLKELYDNDVHALLANEQLLGVYYRTHQTLCVLSELISRHENHLSNSSYSKKDLANLLYSVPLLHKRPSALLRGVMEQRYGVLCEFGGQGYNWLSDLSNVRECYPFVDGLLFHLLDSIQEELQSLPAQTLNFYSHGFNVRQWLSADSDGVPPASYLSSSAISYPMIGITQLLSYYATLQTMHASPSSFAKHVLGFLGHSSGIVPALFASSIQSFAELWELGAKTVKFLFWLGARSQQTFQFSVNHKVSQESTQRGWGMPTPMLSIRGITREFLESQLTVLNGTLPQRQRLSISLINGARTFIISGVPAALHSLRLQLSAFHNVNGESQGRIPHSKRKLNFTAKYLPVSAPFHSKLLEKAVDTVYEDMKRLGMQQLFQAKSLVMPVLSTVDGKNLQKFSEENGQNFLRSVIQMQLTEPLDWNAVCKDGVSDILSTRKIVLSHIVDFGPGGLSGTGRLSSEIFDGMAVKVISTNVLLAAQDQSSNLAGRAMLYDTRSSAVMEPVNWEKKFGPKLVEITEKDVNGKLITRLAIENHWTRLLNLPPLMVSGMTPSTAGEEFVSAVSQAGYFVELAGGGQHTVELFRRRVAGITKSLPVGGSVHINLLFLNPFLWNMQFPLLQQMRREGYPISGITIGAGIPSLDNASSIIQQLQSCGIQLIGFKPGTVEAIEDVRKIAAANPSMKIMIQMTGGRSGGHHSYEDQHWPLLESYSSLRQHSNIILCIGGGLGDSSSTFPYLSGDWSLAYGFQRMPFDGALFASRVMIAKECPTAPACKELIARCPGATDAEWEKSFDTTSATGAGGIITVLSELGEPIHKIANRGTLFWREMDEKYFNLPKDAFVKEITKNKNWLIQKLNNDFQKPYFPVKANGEPADDLSDMSYTQVTQRLLQLSYVRKLTSAVDADFKTKGRAEEKECKSGVLEKEWLDITYQIRWQDWCMRMIEKFASVPQSESTSEETDAIRNMIAQLSSNATNSPQSFIAAFASAYPLASTATLSVDDVHYFLALCKRRTAKPANFVPIIDAELKFYLKKDSLWFSEDLRSVPNEDASRVCILQGPVATKFATKVDEPVKDILHGIHHGVIEMLKQRQPNVLPDSLQATMKLSSAAIEAGRKFLVSDDDNLLDQIRNGLRDGEVIDMALAIPSDFDAKNADIQAWRELLAFSGIDSTTSAFGQFWRSALLLSDAVLREAQWQRNSLQSLLNPRANAVYVFTSSNKQFSGKCISSCRVFYRPLHSAGLSFSSPIVCVEAFEDEEKILIDLRHPKTDETEGVASFRVSTLKLEYFYVHRSTTQAARFGIFKEQPWQERCHAIAAFYRSLWLTGPSSTLSLAVSSSTLTSASSAFLRSSNSRGGRHHGSVVDVSLEEVRRFRDAIDDPFNEFEMDLKAETADASEDKMSAPIDFGIYIAWEQIMGSLLNGAVGRYGCADVLSLVHLSNEFQIETPNSTFFDRNSSALTMSSGQRFWCDSELKGVWDEDSIRVITVQATIKRWKKKVKAANPLKFSSANLAMKNSSSASSLHPVASQSNLSQPGNAHTDSADGDESDSDVECDESKEASAINVRGATRHTANDSNVEFAMSIVSKFAIPLRAVQCNSEEKLALFRDSNYSFRLHFKDEKMLAIFRSKAWHNVPATAVQVDNAILINMDVHESNAKNGSDGKKTVSILTTGKIVHEASNQVLGQIFSSDEDVRACRVLAFLQRYAKNTKQSADLSTPQFFQPTYFSAPISNMFYALASKDVNPIHTNPFAADLAQLPATIVHGMFSSAKCRTLLSKLTNGAAMMKYSANFTAMVVPSAKLVAVPSLSSLVNGCRVYSMELRTVDSGDLVLRASAQVLQSDSAIFYTGQGSAAVAMGMDLYQKSASDSAVRRVWDDADAFFQSKYGFSILDIVQKNPTTVTIPLTGPRGSEWRKNYAQLTTLKPGESTPSPLFPEAHSATCEFVTFRSSGEGLLFQTQFQQPAILLLEKANFEFLKSRGAVGQNFALCGHSLGEYAAVGCLFDGLSIAQLAEIVFLRGMTMQSCVLRDEQNRSRYAMVAVSPIRVSPWFSEDALERLISQLCVFSSTPRLLQIVNYNSERTQYVVAGELTMLEALRLVCDEMFKMTEQLATQGAKKSEPISKAEKDRKMAAIIAATLAGNPPPLPIPMAQLEEIVKEVANRCMKNAEEAVAKTPDGYLPPRRGQATIPLAGIDVPFHSALLRDGVPSFRSILQKSFASVHVRREMIERRYIPNLLGEPFQLSIAFVQKMLSATRSSYVEDVLKFMQECTPSQLAAKESELCKTLLIELLAFQFASPVQWIRTQNYLLKDCGVRRFIEIGPSAVLLNMLKRGMAEPLLKNGQTFEFIWAGKEDAKLFGEEDGSAEPFPVQSGKENGNNETKHTKQEASKPAAAVAPQPPPIAKPAVTPAVPTAAAPVHASAPVSSSGGSASIALSPLHILRTLIALKLKVPFSSIDSSKSVRALCGGKSALQNEILADLSAEFKSEPEGADELPLTELATKLNGANYKQPGKILTPMISQSLSRILPGGYGISRVKDYLKTGFGADQQTVDGILIHSLLVAPPARLNSDEEANSFFDSTATAFASSQGVSLSKASAAAATAGGNAAALVMMDPKELDRLKNLMKKQAQALFAYLEDSSKLSSATKNSAAADISSLSSLLDVALAEHGQKYLEGIRPAFDLKKLREYDSVWAWARQEIITTYATVEQLYHAFKTNNRASGSGSNAITASSYTPSYSANSSVRRLMNTPAFDDFMSNCDERIQIFANRASAPLLKLISQSNVRLFGNADAKNESSQQRMLREFGMKLEQRVALSDQLSMYREFRSSTLPTYSFDEGGQIKFRLGKRYAQAKSNEGFAPFVDEMTKPDNPNRVSLRPAIPLIGEEEKAIDLNDTFIAVLRTASSSGLSLKGKCALLTGASPGSIACEMVRGLLMSGAQVILTTSSANYERWQFYRTLYQSYAGNGSKLSVVPFNGCSLQDTEALAASLFAKDGFNLRSLDFIVPFAAMSENGRDITQIDAQSELAHRCMLTNTVRLIGAVAKLNEQRAANGYVSPSLVLLPLSPNHGLFGGDGLYSESKIALEVLFAKWRAERWGPFISLIGVEIGWTRGTGLMSANDGIAGEIERETSMRTFDTTEMSFLSLALLVPAMAALAKRFPIHADFSGGFHQLAGRPFPMAELRANMLKKSALIKAVFDDQRTDESVTGKVAVKPKKSIGSDAPKNNGRVNLHVEFPPLPAQKPGSIADVQSLHLLQGMMDLSKVVVVAGYGEVSPWGSARTRFEYELLGRFTREGAVELARSMSLIKYHLGGPLQSKDGKQIDAEYVGWIDAKTNEPVADCDVAARYGEYIRSHCGIRPIEPALFDGYDPKEKVFLRQSALEADMDAFEVSSMQEAEYLMRKHGKLISVEKDGERIMAKLKKGAVIYIPRATPFDREVAGQLPTGFNPALYGIPNDVKVDPVTLYALAAAMDAFASAGIRDPYELYHYVHVSEVGNSCGGGMGGMASMKAIFRHRFMDQPNLSSDLLQETFINTTPAWINMLLMSSCGPIKTPVAACCTAATSVEIAVETIRSGRAKVMIAGGFEDFGEEGSYEFAQMKATSSSAVEDSMGRLPHEMCRPTTTTRGGFMEAQGAGIEILMNAETALKMGVPIYAIIGGAFTATDRQGRSVPAPGQGILSTARQINGNAKSSVDILSIEYRRAQFDSGLLALKSWFTSECDAVQANLQQRRAEEKTVEEKTGSTSTPLKKADIVHLLKEYQRRLKSLQAEWSFNAIGSSDEVSPIRSSLAIFGLTVNDLELASFHGTGTHANDVNESSVIQKQMNHLGRRDGAPLPSVFQKWLTGHPKGSAAAWMLHGVIQSLLSGCLPGNRNADNVDVELAGNDHLLYFNQSFAVPRGLRAAYLHSFGFGQAGGEVILIHPDYLYFAVAQNTFDKYLNARNKRQLAITQHWQWHLCANRPLVEVKANAPWAKDEQDAVYLNPKARATYDAHNATWTIKAAANQTVDEAKSDDVSIDNIEKMLTQLDECMEASLLPSVSSGSLAFKSSATRQLESCVQGVSAKLALSSGAVSTPVAFHGVGVDVEEVSAFESKSEEFLSRNFTSAELSYIRCSSSPAATVAGRWCAKEAVVKALSSLAAAKGTKIQWKGGAAPLNEIEVTPSHVSGAPTVQLFGFPASIATALGIDDPTRIALSISHTDMHAIAHAIVSVPAQK